MKTTLKLLAAVLVTVCMAGHAQVAPEATGQGGPGAAPGIAREGKSFQYALRYAETARFSSAIPNQQLGEFTGSLNYVSADDRHPFTIEYGGGYTWAYSGPSYGAGQSQRIFLSQGVNWRKWNFLVSDDASYLPQAPITGFLGIPGTGEPIGITNPTPPSTQTILNLYTHAVENNANGSLGFNLSNATSLTGTGGQVLLRYPNGDGLDTDTLSATGLLKRQLGGRNSLTGTYNYFSYSYPGYDVNFVTNSALLGFEHKWTRNLSTTLAAGPQFITSSVTSIVPSSQNVAVNATVNYLLRFTSASASYTRGTNGGAGYLLGAEVDNISGNLSHQFGLNWTIGLTGGFQRTAGLNNNGTTDGVFGGAEGTYRLGRDVIIFGNYTCDDQWSSSSLPTSALGQLLHTIGFGVGFSPLPRRLRQ